MQSQLQLNNESGIIRGRKELDFRDFDIDRSNEINFTEFATWLKKTGYFVK